MATGVFSESRAKIKERTLRTARWWLQPLITFSVLMSFVVYATFRAFENKYYFAEPLVSPLYSPCLSTACVDGTSPLGQPFNSQYFGIGISPALFILIFPLGFRLTCYYYRKSYYRAFWMSPPSMCSCRTSRKIHRRNSVPFNFAEFTPLVLLCWLSFQRHPYL